MTEVTTQPLLVSDPTYAAPGVILTVETADLNSPAYIRIHRDGSEDILVPLDLVPALSVNLSYFRDVSSETRGELMRAAHNPANTGGPCVEVGPLWVTLPNYDVNVDGTPYLAWLAETGGDSAGWELALQGLESSRSLGFARWDDADGIADLVESMRDPAALLSLAAVIDAPATRVMTNRTAVRELCTSQQNLPEANLETLKSMLDNLESTKAMDKVSGGQRTASILRIPVGDDEKWGVAALVRYAIYSKHHSVEKWLTDAQPELEEAGWRLVTLPVLRKKYHGEVSLWLTPLAKDTWEIVEPVAALHAHAMQQHDR